MKNLGFEPTMLREIFDYKDGILFWRERPESHFASRQYWRVFNSQFPGRPCGCECSNGYLMVRVTVDGKKYRLLIHRAVWAYHHGKWPKDQIDHIDHDRKNNRVENLREVSNQENHRNMRLTRRNSSGVTGVTWVSNRSKWMASITVSGTLKNLGNFETKEQAIAVRLAAEQTHHFHRNHGRAVA